MTGHIAPADAIAEPATYFQHVRQQIYIIIRKIPSIRRHIPKYYSNRFRRFREEIFADNRKSVIFAIHNNGALAERLGTGLQNLLQRFDSARHLFIKSSLMGLQDDAATSKSK